MALVILSEVNPLQAVESILRRTAFVLIPFSLLLIKYLPDLGVMYARWSGELMWVGVADHKNSAAEFYSLFPAFYLFWRVARAWNERRIRVITVQNYADGFVFVLSLYLLKGSHNSFSATSISAFVVGCLYDAGTAVVAWTRHFIGAADIHDDRYRTFYLRMGNSIWFEITGIRHFGTARP